MDAVKGFIPDKLPWWQTGIEVLDTSKGIYIMEKKTRKMTKAEAFEYLKNKKIRCYGKCIELQEKLFSLGFSWKTGSDEALLVEGIIIVDGIMTYTLHLDAFTNVVNEEVLVDDVLAIETVPEDELNSYEKIAKLAQPLMDYLRKIRSSERICISQENVVAEPMPTLISGDMKAC